MNWTKGKKKDLVNVQCVDILRNDYRLIFAVRDYTSTEEGDDSDCEFLYKYVKGEPSTFEFKSMLLSVQDEYDKSSEVNCFYVNGKEAWMDKATRVGLMNSCNILEAAGKTEYTIWFDDQSYTASTQTIKQLIAAVEMYAMNCYNVTERHKAEIDSLSDDRDALFAYQIHVGYPEKLSFNFEPSNESETPAE